MPRQRKAIADIHARMVALVESQTMCPDLRDTVRCMAKEFAQLKSREGLGAPGEAVDVDASARLILKKQIMVLYENRAQFSGEELRRLHDLTEIIRKL